MHLPGGNPSTRSLERIFLNIETKARIAKKTPSQSLSPSVFLIDDSSDVRAFFEVVTAMEGMPLISARDGVDALAKLEALDGDPSVVFVDLNMPVMNGTEFLAKALERGLAKTSRIIVLSGADRSSVNLDPNEVEWLQKPFELGQILGLLSSLRTH